MDTNNNTSFFDLFDKCKRIIKYILHTSTNWNDDGFTQTNIQD